MAPLLAVCRVTFGLQSLRVSLIAPPPPPHVWWMLGTAAAVIVILATSLTTSIIIQQRRLLAATRDFSGRLLAVQEEERARIARELHDDVIQRVALLSLSLDELVRATSVGDLEFERRVQGVRAELADFADDIRVLAHRMHPSVLDHLGLQAALRMLADELRTSGQLDVQVDIRDEIPPVPPAVAAGLYRIAQEALRNVAKHAGVHGAVVRLTHAHGGVELEIEDQGVGFSTDAHRDESGGGLGLRSIGERARQFEGRATIQSKPGGGTQVSVWIPLR